MAFSKKTWKDRVSEQPQRRLLTPTGGGTSYTVDVTRQEGIVVQEGDAFSASNMNDLETRIKNTFDSDEATLSTVNTKANTNASNISTLQTNVNNLSSQKAPNNHASTGQTYGVGSTSAFGHLKINDSYTSSSGAASQGVAASSKAVNDAYNNLNNKITTTNNNVSGLTTRMGTVEGNINSLSGRVSTTEGKITTAEGNINSLSGRVSTTEGKITTVEDELTANGNRIYMDYKNGKYGYNTSANRGADTFHPFNDVSKQYYLGAIYIGNLTEGYSYVRAQYVVNNKSSNQTWGMIGRGTGTASLNGLSIITAYESRWVATVNSNKAGKLYENTSSGTSLVATFGSGGGQYVSTQHIQPGGNYGVSFYFEAD